MKENKIKKETDDYLKDEMQELEMEDLSAVSGGAGLRTAPKTSTTSISENTKSKI